MPLTKADVDFYMDILAARRRRPQRAPDRRRQGGYIDFTIQMQKHPPAEPKGPMTQAFMDQMTRNAKLAARAAELATYDNKIAEQRGVPNRYEAVKNEVESVLAQLTGEGASCGGDDCGGSLTAADIARGKREEIASKADKPLIAPHVAEIKALKKQIGGFMFGGH